MTRKLIFSLLLICFLLIPTVAAEYHEIVFNLTNSGEVVQEGTHIDYDALTDSNKVIYRVEFRTEVGSITNFTLYQGNEEIEGSIETRVTSYPYRVMNITLSGESDSEESYALINTRQSFNVIPCFVGEDTEDTGLLFARWTYGSYKTGSQSDPSVFISLPDIKTKPITRVSVSSTEEMELIIGVTPYEQYSTGNPYLPGSSWIDIAWDIIGIVWTLILVVIWFIKFFIAYAPLLIGYTELFILAFSAYQASGRSPPNAIAHFFRSVFRYNKAVFEFVFNILSKLVEMAIGIINAIIPF